MKALRYQGQGNVAVEEIPEPIPGRDEVLVQVEASAVCGSERPSLIEGTAGNAGHEACGTVIVPRDSRFRAGDRVGLSAIVGCGRCRACREGRELHCPEWQASSSVGWHAERVAVHKDALYRIPDGIDATLGVLLSGDSLGVPARSLSRMPTVEGDIVVIIGLGPVGLGHLMVRAHAGARVIAIEPSEYRRNLAKTLGAERVLPPGEPVAERAAVVIECTGRPDCIKLAFELVENGGTILQSGEYHGTVPISPSDQIIRREITYTGSWYFTREDYGAMIDLLQAGLPLSRIMTHEVDPDGAPEAIAEFLEGRSGKVVIRWKAEPHGAWTPPLATAANPKGDGGNDAR